MRIGPLVMALLIAGCTAAGEGDGVTTTTAVPTTSVTSPPLNTTTTVDDTTTSVATSTTEDPTALTVEAFPVPEGSHPHDVAPAADGGVWYTAQGSGDLGWLEPVTGETRHIDLGAGSAPHGVIVDAEGTPWITDAGLNSIVSVDPETDQVTLWHLPDTVSDANLNTAVFDDDGILWFTGQAGVYGSLDPSLPDEMVVYEAPGGRGPYGITAAPDGTVYYASLAGSYVGRIEGDGSATALEPPTPGQGARRVWTDSTGGIWVSEWNAGQVARYDPAADSWTEWALPGDGPAAYAVFVDDRDIVWLSDFSSNSLVRFDPDTEAFTAYSLPHQPGEVRQIHGRPGEVWGAESAADHLVVIRTN